MFADPYLHHMCPPESWRVVKRGERAWQIVTPGGAVLQQTETKRAAEALRDDPQSWERRLYDDFTRWYAGETPRGQRPWLECKAERERTFARRGR